MNATSTLIDHCCSIEYERVPAPAIAAAKQQILDCLACGLVGTEAPGVQELIGLNKVWGGAEECSVFGHMLSLPMPNAAQVNVTMMHARDYDDVHARGLMHPGIVSVGTALAVAEKIGNISGKEFLAVVAMGTDLICRMGMAVDTDQPRSVTGWHFTSIFGFPASAAVCGRLLGLNPKRMLNALGIAYHQSAGNGQCVLDGALTKRLGPGFAVQGGITAALLAAEGMTGASGWLEGEAGLYQQYFRKPCNEEVLLSGMGVCFEGTNVAAKRYGCCGVNHPFIEAALHLIRANEFFIEDIEEIRVYHGDGARFMVEPIDAKRNPRNPVDSQFSVPWAVSAALAYGHVSLKHFSETGIADTAISNLSGKTIPVYDESMTRINGNEDGRVELKLTGDRILSARCKSQINEGGDHMDFEGCVKKFDDCVRFSGLQISDQQVSEIAETVRGLEEMSAVSLNQIIH